MTVIDFRRTRWGHNIYLKSTNKDCFSGLVICTPAPKVWDTMLWKTAYGYVEARVDYVQPKGDPSDMYTVTARVVRRIADPNIVSQEEIDQHFGTKK